MKLLLVGCGKMGGALLGGLIANGIAKNDVLVADPYPQIANEYGIRAISEIKDIGNFTPDTILLAVKPQMMDEILEQLASKVNDKTLILSVAAGKTIEYYSKYFKNSPIIRSMPNLPSLVGKGASVLYANDKVTSSLKNNAEKLFSSVGTIFWIENESMLDAVTAISGSGPAYVFHFLECLTKAAEKLGLPSELAKMLAYSTLSGSAQLAEESEKTAQQLKQQVMSPKGTTEAGINVLSANDDLEKLVYNTAKAAYERSKELA